jgi:hypothetical protein
MQAVKRGLMMADDMGVAIARQRTQLTKKRDDVQTNIGALQTQLAEIDRQFAAVLAYENTLAGELPDPSVAKRHRSAKPARRGEKQAQVVQVIAQQAGGMTRGEVIDALGLKDSKPGVQSVSNALTALKKAGKIASVDGKWQVAAGATAKKGKKGMRKRKATGAR